MKNNVALIMGLIFLLSTGVFMSCGNQTTDQTFANEGHSVSESSSGIGDPLDGNPSGNASDLDDMD